MLEIKRDRRLVVFDCDGTMIDSQNTIISSMVKAFESHGLNAPEDGDVRRIVGLSLLDAIQRLYPKGDYADYQVLANSYKTAFAEAQSRKEFEEPLFSGAKEAIIALQTEGYLLGVATGKSRRGLERSLARHGLRKYFTTLHTSDDGPGKPDPSMVERAMDITGVQPRKTTVIGDTTYDISMARNAGVYAVGVTWGYHETAELRQAGAHAIVERFSDIFHAVASLIGE